MSAPAQLRANACMPAAPDCSARRFTSPAAACSSQGILPAAGVFSHPRAWVMRTSLLVLGAAAVLSPLFSAMSPRGFSHV